MLTGPCFMYRCVRVSDFFFGTYNIHVPADLFIRIYDATDEREGISAALDVMWMMMKPGIEAAMDGRPLKPCHLTTGIPICSISLSILKLVQVNCFFCLPDTVRLQLHK